MSHGCQDTSILCYHLNNEIICESSIGDDKGSKDGIITAESNFPKLGSLLILLPLMVVKQRVDTEVRVGDTFSYTAKISRMVLCAYVL